MTASRASAEAVQWFGVLGSPFAWTAQHVVGFALSEIGCRETGMSGWVDHVDGWVLAVTLAAAAVVVASGAAAVATYRRTRPVDEQGAPPRARMYFLSLIGIAVCPLFLAMVLMSGVGFVQLTGCTES